MTSISTFFRKTPIASLEAYVRTKPNLHALVDWSLPEDEAVSDLIRAAGQLPAADRETLVLEIERIAALADEAGQTALYSIISNVVHFGTISGPNSQALWVFLNEPEKFRLAEEVRFNDEKRRGRTWTGFVVEKNLVVRKDSASIDAFAAELREKFNITNVHIDVFDRYRITFEGSDRKLVQVTVYREGRADDTLGFDEGGRLKRHLVKPVYEGSLTYDPQAGVIEVVANSKEIREAMAAFMGRHLLKIDFRGNKLPARQYDLSVLMTPFDFPRDPLDGIEYIEVRELRFQPLDDANMRLSIEIVDETFGTMWDLADLHVASAEQRQADWLVTRARIRLKYRPKTGSRSLKSFELTLTTPHGCNLKDMTPFERLIGEKYLRQWGILLGDTTTAVMGPPDSEGARGG